MSKVFVGTGYEGPTRYDVQVEEDGKSYNLTHAVRGIDTDLQWDGSGPQSADLARALLWNVTGVVPEWTTYRLFKSEVVANWPMQAGECWRISDAEIKQWLDGVEQASAKTGSASRADARSGQMNDRAHRMQGFSRAFDRKK